MPSIWRRLFSRGAGDRNGRRSRYHPRSGSISPRRPSSRREHDWSQHRHYGREQSRGQHNPLVPRSQPQPLGKPSRDGRRGIGKPYLDTADIIPRDRLDGRRQRVYDRIMIWAYRNFNDCSEEEAVHALAKDGLIEPSTQLADNIRWSEIQDRKSEKLSRRHNWDMRVDADGVTRRKQSKHQARSSSAGQHLPSTSRNRLEELASRGTINRGSVDEDANPKGRGRSETPHSQRSHDDAEDVHQSRAKRDRKPPDSMAKYLPAKSSATSGDHNEANFEILPNYSMPKALKQNQRGPIAVPANPNIVHRRNPTPVKKSSNAPAPGKSLLMGLSSSHQSQVRSPPVPDPPLPPDPGSLKEAASLRAKKGSADRKQSPQNTMPDLRPPDATPQRALSPIIWGNATRTMVPCATRGPSGFLVQAANTTPKLQTVHSATIVQKSTSVQRPANVRNPTSVQSHMTVQQAMTVHKPTTVQKVATVLKGQGPPPIPVPPSMLASPPAPVSLNLWGDNTRTIVPAKYQTPAPGI